MLKQFKKKGNPGKARQQELADLIRLANKYMWNDTEAHTVLQEAGVTIEPARFYSQRPTVADIQNSFEYSSAFTEYGPYFDPEIFNLAAISTYCAEIEPFAGEFNPPQEGNLNDPAGFFWRNPAFSFADAMAYWCTIRARKPNKVIEIGSGFSSLIAADALKANGHGELVCIEPYPKDWLARSLPEMRLIKAPVQSLDPQIIADEFSDGDILFIDSTHTVKIGSDCLWIYLRLLASINKHLLVHVHDIFLPFAHPQQAVLEKHVHWTEAYLLLAYLTDNPRTDVVFGSMLTARFLPKEAQRLMGGKWSAGGGSFWFTQAPRVD